MFKLYEKMYKPKRDKELLTAAPITSAITKRVKLVITKPKRYMLSRS